MNVLSPVDQLFLYLEKRQQPMHVAGLQVFSRPADAGADYIGELATAMRQYRYAEPPFNQTLQRRFGQWFWQHDSRFDLEHHFYHQVLPTPGYDRDLWAWVAARHGRLLDRSRPPWEVYLLEGLQGGRFALYTKVHHCLMDGVSAMRLGRRVLSPDPNRRGLPPVWARSSAHPDGRPVGAVDAIAGLVGGLRRQCLTLPTLARELYRIGDKARNDPHRVSPFQAPRTILNQPVGGARLFAARSYSLARIEALATIFDCTVNDVVLSLLGQTLRRYLERHNALPDHPLIALVPVSLRAGRSTGGNRVAMILANLGTHMRDPAERLRLVQASIREAKQRHARMTAEETLNLSILSLIPTGLHLLTGRAAQWCAFNVVISNVPGPRRTQYWNGARLEGLYPASLVLDHIALNLTFTSYQGRLEFGLVACRQTVPTAGRILDDVKTAIRDLEEAAGARLEADL